MQPLNYRHFKPNGDIKVIVSEHRDGETIRKVVEYLGVGALSGSSTRGGAKALLGAIKSLKNGIDVAITPDGPKGPIYGIADGIVVIAQKTKSKILPFSCIPSSYWQFKSWDKFVVPKPFGTIEFYIGEPFSIEELDMEQSKKVIYDKMMENQLDKG
ncbi:MAG: lysophospholipid acyltransferase family protein [Campylobacterota bacterium]|nr:lysophospholipid acyltransferase family protein [Campylobacterota bacterium]